MRTDRETATVFVNRCWQQTWVGFGSLTRAQGQIAALALFGIQAELRTPDDN